MRVFDTHDIHKQERICAQLVQIVNFGDKRECERLLKKLRRIEISEVQFLDGLYRKYRYKIR